MSHLKLKWLELEVSIDCRFSDSFLAHLIGCTSVRAIHPELMTIFSIKKVRYLIQMDFTISVCIQHQKERT